MNQTRSDRVFYLSTVAIIILGLTDIFAAFVLVHGYLILRVFVCIGGIWLITMAGYHILEKC